MRRTSFLLATILLLTGGCASTPDGGGPEAPTGDAPSNDASESATSSAAAGASGCSARIGAANDAYAAGDHAAAIAELDTAWSECGDGHDILEMKAVIVAVGGDPEGAAELVLREIADPPASEEAFALVAQLMPALSAASQAQIRGLGSSPDTAIHAPSMRAEYTWATDVVCGGEEPESFGQGTMMHAGATVELLTFDCPGGESHDVYFHPPPDPLEKMFEERLGE